MVAAVREKPRKSEMSRKEEIGQVIRNISGNFKVGQGKIKCKGICNLSCNYFYMQFNM